MKKVHRIIIAAAVLVVLGAAYTLVKVLPRPGAEQSASPAAPEIRLTEVEKEKISGMILEQGDSTLTVTRKGDAWSIEYPYPVELDQSALDSLAASFADLRADRLIAEHPDDLVQFGLQKPSVTATVETSDGKRQTVLLGGTVPSGYGYYMKKQGEDAVYTVSSSDAYNFQKNFSDFRVRTLGQPVDFESLEYMFISGSRGPVEIRKLAENDVLYNEMSAFALTRPYRSRQAVDSEAFGKLVQGIPEFVVKDFINDSPKDYRQYGLDRPSAEYQARDGKGNSIHLYFGSLRDGNSRYARLADEKRVFTVDTGSLAMLEATPFSLAGKFALLVGITSVETAEIRLPDSTIRIEVKRTPSADPAEEPKETFFVNGKEAEDSEFRKFYQEMIGFLCDGENPKPVPGDPVLTISYRLNETAGTPSVSVSFVPFNRDFHQVYRNGISEFLVSREQVERFLTRAAEYARQFS